MTRSAKRKRSKDNKEHTTIVSYRLAGQMKTDGDCYIGCIGAPNRAAAMRMTVADVKQAIANKHQMPVSDIELVGVWGDREKREAAEQAAAEKNGLTVYCYQIKGKMESDEHCYPAFLSGDLENATEDAIRQVIAANCQEPVENIALVGGERARKFQRRYKDGWDMLLNRPAPSMPAMAH